MWWSILNTCRYMLRWNFSIVNVHFAIFVGIFFFALCVLFGSYLLTKPVVMLLPVVNCFVWNSFPLSDRLLYCNFWDSFGSRSPPCLINFCQCLSSNIMCDYNLKVCLTILRNWARHFNMKHSKCISEIKMLMLSWLCLYILWTSAKNSSKCEVLLFRFGF